MLLICFKLLSTSICTIALTGAGIGVGLLFNGFLNSFSRNPKLKEELFSFLIIGFALIEATALFSILIGFLLLFIY